MQTLNLNLNMLLCFFFHYFLSSSFLRTKYKVNIRFALNHIDIVWTSFNEVHDFKSHLHD